jgi:hypothetical protein
MRYIDSLAIIIDDINNQIDATKFIINELNCDIKNPVVYYEEDQFSIRWYGVESRRFAYLEIMVNQYGYCEYVYALEKCGEIERGRFQQNAKLPQNVVTYLDDNFKKE